MKKVILIALLAVTFSPAEVAEIDDALRQMEMSEVFGGSRVVKGT